jgi:hypothetical protein
MPRHLPWCAVLVGSLGIVGCHPGEGQKAGESDESPIVGTEASRADGAPDTVRQRHVTPGAKGEPPGELRVFEPPCTLIEAGGFADGGTTWVALRDQAGTYLLFCVHQNLFENRFPPNALFVGAYHPEETSARLPFTTEEANLVITSLESALALHLPPEEMGQPDRVGDPTMEQIVDRLRPAEEKRSQEDWNLAFAKSALRRLKAVQKFPLADRGEVKARTARLAAINLEDAARAFRERAGELRRSEWETLEPVLKGRVQDMGAGANLAEFFTQTLGPPDAAALKEVESMVQSPFGNPSPINGDVFAYPLGIDGLQYTLIVDFRGGNGANFSVMGSSAP